MDYFWFYKNAFFIEFLFRESMVFILCVDF